MWFEECGRILDTAGGKSFVLDKGEGAAVVLLHGSGPGATAGVNWYRNIESLARNFRVIAPDFAGWGRSEWPADGAYSTRMWVEQVISVLDVLGIPKAHIVGNSLGARIGLNLASVEPARVGRLILMGGSSPSMGKSPGRSAVYRYEPSLDHMRSILRDLFAYDPEIVEEAMVERRYADSVRPGAQEEYVKITEAIVRDTSPGMFTPDLVRGVKRPTLIIQGRDDRVVPLRCATELAELIDGAELHVFNRCGHWAQIEHAERFNALVTDFLNTDPGQTA